MKRDEDRDLARATEDDNADEKAKTQWLESGAEDPAFFIKPSEEK